MALSLIKSELFQPAGEFLVRSTDVRDASNPGYADGITAGTIYCDRIGPGGYSGRPQAYGYVTATGNLAQWALEHKWLRIRNYVNVSYYPLLSCIQYNDVSSSFMHVYPKTGGKFGLYHGFQAPLVSDSTSSVDVPINSWFELKTLFRYADTGGGNYTYYADVKIRLPGESSWTTVFDEQWVVANPGLGVGQVMAGLRTGGGSSINCRVGAIRIWTSSTPTVDTDGINYIDESVDDPVEEPHHWYVSPDGDDDNDGSEAHPLLTLAALSALSGDAYGLLDVNLDATAADTAETALRAALADDQDDVSSELAAYEAAVVAMFEGGDGAVVHIPDGFIPGTEFLDIRTAGCTIKNEGTLDCRLELPSGSWSKTDGYTNLYEITPTGGGMTSVALFRGDIWLPKLNLDDYANQAALLTALDSATAGTWYCNDTKFWITGTNPATDGYTYLRTCDRQNNNAGAIRIRDAESIRVTGGSIVGTVRATKEAGGPYADYAVELQGNLTGHCIVDNLTTDKTDKHSIGLVVGTLDVAILMMDTVCQGTNSFDTGGYSPHVDFSDEHAGFGADIRVYRSRCTVPFIKATMFTNTGTSEGFYAYDCHNTSGPAFTTTLWYDCDLGSGILDEQGAHTSTEKLHIRDTTLGAIVWRASSGIDVRRSKFKYAAPVGSGTDTAENVCLNCLFTFGARAIATPIATGMTLLGNTFDLTGFSSPAVYSDNGAAVEIVAKGNLVIAGDATSFLSGEDGPDTVTLADNVYAATVELAGVNSIYRPRAGSSVLEGTDTTEITQLAATLDYRGDARPGSGALSVGALEEIAVLQFPGVRRVYAYDITAYIGETSPKTLVVTNDRQVGQDLGDHASLSITIETQGTTRTVLQTVTNGSIDRTDDADGILLFDISSTVTATDNAGKTFNLYLRGDDGELIAECKVPVRYAGGA